MDKEENRTETGEPDDQGLWGSIKSLFVPDEDAHGYRHAIGAGHAMLVVTPTAASDRSNIIDVLESTDPIDFDSKLAEWRQSGYDYSAGGTSSIDNPAATRTMATQTDVAAPMAGAAMGATGTTMGSTIGATGATTGVTKPATGAAAPMTGAAASDTDTIKVMEERLRVGKREVAQGAVRIRSYVVERPVEEQVRLHEERISVERRPVDRAATDADSTAFQERTIEARATSEEAVISKETRVVEEIGLHKDATDRVETVRDTVRKTEVDVEDGTTSVPGGSGKSSTGSMGTGGSTTNATPGATTSGMNAPRK
ncbi:MAG: YsnF/AvaK domain-containing protein [Gemmatimonadaceae bacterium]|nr:YsnF/AvaK domain-containing protein [Acetobacteraceae bacterium]